MPSQHSPKDMRALAHWLDSAIPLPFGIRVGWDGIIGLIPGVGNIATTGISFYILARAASVGAPASVISRMGLNLLIDNLFDALPIFGNLFDFFWKANEKNVALLDRHLENPGKTARGSRWVVGLTLFAIFAVIVATMVGTIWLAIWLVRELLHA